MIIYTGAYEPIPNVSCALATAPIRRCNALGMNEPDLIAEIFANTTTIAVVGLSDKPGRPSTSVSSYIKKVGYRIVPVNPTLNTALSEKAYAAVVDIPGPVDLVNVFRAADALPAVVEDVIAKGGVKYLWIQSGIVNVAAAKMAEDAGLKVVMDRCIYVEHARRAPL